MYIYVRILRIYNIKYVYIDLKNMYHLLPLPDPDSLYRYIGISKNSDDVSKLPNPAQTPSPFDAKNRFFSP